MFKRDRIAQALAASPPYDPQGFDKDIYGPGLEPPAIDPIMLFSSAAGPALAKALVGMGRMTPRLMTQEAGAIFPEGMAMPKDRSLLKEFGEVLPESQKIYRRNESLANWHAENLDFPAVLRDKWALLKNAGGSY